MNWCFAKVNNKLAELYFEKGKSKTKILGHCYVKPEEYKTKTERKWIIEDSTKVQFSYRKGQYSEKLKN